MFKQSLSRLGAVKIHKVAMLGWGTVGKGFAEIIKKKHGFLVKKYGVDVRIVAVSDFMKGSVYCPDGLPLDSLLAWDKSLDEFQPSGASGVKNGLDGLATCGSGVEADSLCEVTFTNLDDGTPAISHVKTALESGKNVITTNKGPVVFAYDELDEIARAKNLRFMIEGAIMSGTPIVSLMRNLPACSYSEISGILNGTCNYILTEMEGADGKEFDPCLKEAQRLGYAEANPSFDIGGGDARAKAIILTKILKDPFKSSDIFLEGIEGISKKMVDDAVAEGKKYKLTSQIVFENDKIKSIEVKPQKLCMKTHPLANVGGCLNALNFKTDMLGSDLTMIGPGAGKIETGYSLFSDLMYLLEADKKEP